MQTRWHATPIFPSKLFWLAMVHAWTGRLSSLIEHVTTGRSSDRRLYVAVEDVYDELGAASRDTLVTTKRCMCDVDAT